MNENEIIIEALRVYHSHCVTQSVRKRTIGKPSFSFKEMQKKEKISEAWKAKAKQVLELLIKLDVVNN